jgi:prepilin-type N-terminal cleavage/methylation domain-containing protein
MRRRRQTWGFTLIELLAVIAILAVLAALLFPTLNGMRRKGLQAQCVSNLRQLGMAIVMYQGEHGGKFPAPFHAEFRFTRSDQNGPGLASLLEPYHPFRRARDKWGNETAMVDVKHSCPLYKEANIAFDSGSVGYGAYAYRHVLQTPYDENGNAQITPARLGGNHPSLLAGDQGLSSWQFGRWKPSQFGLVYDKGWIDYPEVTEPHDWNGIAAHAPVFNVLFADLHVGQHKWVHRNGHIPNGSFPNVPPELRNDQYGSPE